MPIIPNYQKQVEEQGLPGTRQQSIASPGLFDTTGATAQVGQGLTGLGDSLARHAAELQDKEDIAINTQAWAKANNEITDFKIEARKRQGDLARGLPEEADKFYSDIAKKYIDAAPNEKGKHYLQLSFAQQQASFHGYIGSHAAEQIDKAAEAGMDALIASHKNAAAIDPSMADASAKELSAAVRLQLNKKGVTDPVVIEQATLEQTSALHAGVINTLLVHNPTAAVAYFGVHKDGITGDLQSKIEGHLKATVDANDALAGADKVWKDLGPKMDGQPAQLDVMEAKVRDMFAGDAGKIKDTIAEVRSRVSAFNSSEAERAASNTNAVMAKFSQGASLAQLKAMPEYQNLPGDRKLSIQEHVETKALQAESRAATRESRAEIAAAKAERQMQKKNFAAYLIYSKPDVLAGMTENQLISMIPQLGEQQVANLVNDKRKLNDPNKVIAAQVDHDDLYQSAQAMGLNPYKTRQTEEEKAALGALAFRTKNLIDIEQSRAGRPLSRAEKQSIMRQEAARTVTVDGGWLGSDKSVPVIALKAEQVKEVRLSPQDRNQATIRLKKMHERYPDDPRYQPTEDNLRMMYLHSKSLTASDIQ